MYELPVRKSCMEESQVRLSRKIFGSHNGREIDLFTVSNNNGLVVSLTNYGGIITSIRTPDRNGVIGNVILGYETLEHYVDDGHYVGCLVGRYANRIARGCCQIDGKKYQLFCNDGNHHIHGGREGFNKKIWEAETVRESRGCGVKLYLTSPDGEEGYPGTVDVQVLYLLTLDNSLIVDYSAATDTKTIINLTQHSYFNLAGKGTINNHMIRINAQGYTPADESLIPTGSFKTVEGTPFDLNKEKRIDQACADMVPSELVNGGFDHNFVLDGDRADTPAAILYHPGSGRELEIYTTEPGLQFYTGNNLDGTAPFCKHGAVCLEAQHFPDSPNKRAFPSVILEPGYVYHQETRYQFGIRKRP